MATETGRLLVVDDVEMNRDLLSRRLEQQGHSVALAENGRRALEMVRAGEFDLVLLDIMMPEVDGYQVLKEMMDDPVLKHIPVVMISAVTEMDSVVKCIEMGATDYLPKPFNPVLLRARVGATLEKKRLRDRERLWAKSLERELEIGREIQKSFLPEAGRIGLVVADVCDKGVGAALFMALFRSLLRATATGDSARQASDPAAELLRAVRLTNDYIARTHGRSNMFATLFFGVLEPSTGLLLYVNGGHDAPVVFGSGGARARLLPTGPAVGMMPEMTFQVGQARLEAGEGLLAFTDGVTDARGASGRYGEERLLALLREPYTSASSLLDSIEESVSIYSADEEQADDITLLAVRRQSP